MSNNTNDLTYIKTRLKTYFISPQNSNYILQKAISELSNQFSKEQIQFNIEKHKRNLFELQNFIFDTYFEQLINDNKNIIDQIVPALNTLTIREIKSVITADIHIQIKTTFESPKEEIVEKNEKIENEEKNKIDIGIQTDDTKKDDKKKDDMYLEENYKKLLDMHTKLEIKVNKNLEKIKQQQSPLSIPSVVSIPKVAKLHHFFCNDAEYIDGKYKFTLKLPDIKTIYIHSFKFNDNLYNITEYNNSIKISEPNRVIEFKIPIGYYKIESLIEKIKNLLNEKSEYEYSIFINDIKNKVYITCKELDYFNIEFESDDDNICLGTLLGFNKKEYFQNNMYISENNITNKNLNDVYLKIFINNKELVKYTTTKNNFNYFDYYKLNTVLGDTFYKTYCSKDLYKLENVKNIENISFELMNIPYNFLQFNSLDFEIVLGFE